MQPIPYFGQAGTGSGNYIYWTADELFYLAKDSSTIVVVESGYDVHIHYKKGNTALDEMTDTPLVPVRYHRGIVDAIIATGYEVPENLNLNLAKYFRSGYEKAVREAKIESRRNKRVGGTVQSHEL